MKRKKGKKKPKLEKNKLFSKTEVYVCAPCKKESSWLLPDSHLCQSQRNPAEIQLYPGSSFF